MIGGLGGIGWVRRMPVRAGRGWPAHGAARPSATRRPIALEVENGRVDLTDGSGESTETAACRSPDHPEPNMRRPTVAGGLRPVVGQGGDPMDVEAFGDLDHDLLESMAFPDGA